MHGTELLQMSCSTKQDMSSKLVMWLLQPIVFSWRQNNSKVLTPKLFCLMKQNRQSTKLYVVHRNTLSDSFRIRIEWFFRIRIVWFQYFRSLAFFSLRKQLSILKTLFNGLSSKRFSVTDITEFSAETKDTCTWVDQRCSGNIIGAGTLLGVFAYICGQRPVIHYIHWWRWWSGAPAAWHHWCWRSQN